MMQSRWLCGATACLLVATGRVLGAASEPAGAPADLILRGGAIYLPDGWAESVAIRDGIIVAVGSDDELAKLRSDRTRVVELDGAAVLPGLHDNHVHALGSGQMQTQCLFPQGSSPQQVLDAVAGCADRKGEGEWIVGGQWDAASFGSTPPHRAMLDRVAPDHPVALTDISVHSLWVNTRALELAGITADTPDPAGGIIERDSEGRPTGVLRESAGGLVRRIIPPSTPEQNIEALRWSLDYMLANGITSFTDAGVDEEALRAYAALADQGRLKQRVRACQTGRALVAPDSRFDEKALANVHRLRNAYARERLRPDCVKLGLDGVPTDGHTAAMVEPYADAHDHGDPRARGILMVPPERLEAVVIALDAHGFTVKMHAAGDAAVRAGLDAIAAARKANGFSGLLHDVSHNSFVQMSDIRRARGIGATFEMSPYIWYPNPIIPDIARAVGPERMERWTPVKDALDAGALVVPGSDWAVVPSVNPWIAIETLVTRQKPGGGGEALGAGQRITLREAIEMFTVSSAVQMGHRDRVGTIQPGMLADLVVLDRNPFAIPISEVHRIRVKATLIGGEIVHEETPE